MTDGWGGWTDEAVARASKMWLNNISATTIGLEMGVSRNSVIAKMHRMGLPKGVLFGRDRSEKTRRDPPALAGQSGPGGDGPNRTETVEPPSASCPDPTPSLTLDQAWERAKARRNAMTKALPGTIPVDASASNAQDGVPFLLVREGQCKFPLWAFDSQIPIEEKRVCGCPRWGTTSWCETHLKRVSDPVRRLKYAKV